MLVDILLVRSCVSTRSIHPAIYMHASALQDTGRRKHKKKHKHKSAVLMRFLYLHGSSFLAFSVIVLSSPHDPNP